MLESYSHTRLLVAIFVVTRAAWGIADDIIETDAPATSINGQVLVSQLPVPRVPGKVGPVVEFWKLIESRLAEPGAALPTPPEGQVLVLPSELCAWSTNIYGNDGIRYLMVGVLVANPTTHDVKADVQAATLLINGEPFSSSSHDRALKQQPIYIGQNKSSSPDEWQHQAPLVIPAGTSAAFRLVFSPVTLQESPALMLKINVAGQDLVLDLMRFERGLLGLSERRIGPRNCLALLEISGRLDTVNVNLLNERFDKLTTEKVTRVVVHFMPQAEPIDDQLDQWLASSGENEMNWGFATLFPPKPTDISELYVAGRPNNESGPNAYRDYGQRQNRSYAKLGPAVSAALDTLYESASPALIVSEIEHGHPASRSAALKHAGDRLGAEHLASLLKWSTDADAELRRASLSALGEQPDPRAAQRLCDVARGYDVDDALAAVSSLAQSPRKLNRDALQELLRSQSLTLPQHQLLHALSRAPRPEWMPTILAAMDDKNATVRVAALDALSAVGHPDLVAVLQRHLGDPDESVRDRAFALLIARDDSESERLAIVFAKARLQEKPAEIPQPISELINRTRDNDLIELLYENYTAAKIGGDNAIPLLMQCGHSATIEKLIERMPEMSSSEQMTVLNSIQGQRYPQLLPMAIELAQSTKDQNIRNQLVQYLIQNGSSEAITTLIELIEAAPDDGSSHWMIMYLGNSNTHIAREGLRKLRESADVESKARIEAALEQGLMRSPAYYYIQTGFQYEEQENFTAARDSYSLAVEIDPLQPRARLRYGGIHLRFNEPQKALEQYDKALELQPAYGESVTGRAIALAMLGRIDDAKIAIASAQDLHTSNQIYAYNTACMYSRAAEHLEKQPASEARDKQLAECLEQALALLKKSIDLGFTDFGFIEKDPDLVSLRNLPGYSQLKEEWKTRPLPDSPDAGEAPADQEPIEVPITDEQIGDEAAP